MTQRNRPRSRPARAQRRGRRVWVNENINSVPADNTIEAIDCLTAAADFMTFDTTIEAVIIPDMAYSFQKLTAGVVDFRMALIVGPTTLDNDDFQTLFADSIGAPWLGVWGAHARIPDQGLLTFALAAGFDVIRVKAKRRFRENDSTLWLVIQNVVTSGTTINENLGGMVRTLLHIP